MLRHDAVFALFVLGIVEPGIFALDAFFIRVGEALPNVGGLQKRFSRDAAHQQAGAPQPGLFFDKRGFHAVLARANSSGVTTWATPNHNQIVWHCFHSNRQRGGGKRLSRKRSAARRPRSANQSVAASASSSA